MVWLEFKNVNIDKGLYILKDKYNNTYELVLRFLDIEKMPKIGDNICINDRLLNGNYEGYSLFYTFGSLDNKYGKENIALDDVDVITLVLDKKEIYLKRLYG